MASQGLLPSAGRSSLATATVTVISMTALGCSAHWPMSDDLEESIRAEASTLSPSIGEHEEVLRRAMAVAEGGLPNPEAFSLPEEPTLDDYLRLALARNPRIQVMVRNLEALGMRVPQVTSLSDPMLAFAPPIGRMTQTAAGQVDATLGLSQQVPFPSKLAARGRLAEQVVRIGLEDLRHVRLQVIADVKNAYYSYYLTTVSIEVTRASRDLLERIRAVADAKLRSGTAPQQDVLRAEVELYNVSNDLLMLEQERRTSTALLNALMDRSVDAELPPPQRFDPDRMEWRLDELLARAVEKSPDLEAIREQVRRDLEAIHLAKLEYLPDFQVGGAYSWIGGGISPVATGQDVWSLTLGMSLPVWLHRIRAGIYQRNAEALSSALQYRSRRNDVFFAIQDSLARVDARYRSAILFRDSLLPRARQTVEVSQSGYRAGRLDFLTWIDNWRRLLEFTLEYHRSLAGLEREFANLELLVGGDLDRSSSQEGDSEP